MTAAALALRWISLASLAAPTKPVHWLYSRRRYAAAALALRASNASAWVSSQR